MAHADTVAMSMVTDRKRKSIAVSIMSIQGQGIGLRRTSNVIPLFAANLASWTWRGARGRFTNAGVTYNTGNWLAIVGAIAQVVTNAHSGMEFAFGLGSQFVGNLPAFAATLGTAAFFHAGRKYDQAWQDGFPPHDGASRKGHLWSAVGATLIGLGLIGLATTRVAMAAAIGGGTLHAGGKIGSFLARSGGRSFKYLPLLSRLPALISLSLDLAQRGHGHLLPLALVIANVLWARADVMLMQDGPAKRILGTLLFVPQ